MSTPAPYQCMLVHVVDAPDFRFNVGTLVFMPPNNSTFTLPST